MPETEKQLSVEALSEAYPLILKAVSGLYRTPVILPQPLPQIPLPVTPHPGPIPTSLGPTFESLDGDLMAQSDADEAQLGLLPIQPFTRIVADLRLDVDRFYPQMSASGTLRIGGTVRTHWIAKVRPSGTDTWEGPIWFRDGTTTLFPYTRAHVQVNRVARNAILTLSVGGLTPRLRLGLAYTSPYFHPVDFEFDYAVGETPTLDVNTYEHPNHPATIASETLSIPTVFRRSGFNVTVSPGSPVPIDGAGPDAKWSDQEMHDAMQVAWTHYDSIAQWAIWVFFASLHEDGPNLGGIMFDDIGPQHRQGTAIFDDSFISIPPAGDLNAAAWVKRMLFWTAVHEMGHTFNLAHSWQKALGTPWIPLANDPAALSFMNYPYRYPGGEVPFFANFEYRFSDDELLFMRHAPERFVQQGNAEWFDHHGFERRDASKPARLRIKVRANREEAKFDFLEPVVLELKLTNTSTEPVLVDERTLLHTDALTVILKKRGKPARQWKPYATQCWKESGVALKPGQSLYESLFVSAGLNGWDIAEPGEYLVQVGFEHEGEQIVSDPLVLFVAPPHDRQDETLAQKLFTDEVGRILTFDGSRFLGKGNDTLREVCDKLKGRAVARHAEIALGNAYGRTFKSLNPNGGIKQPLVVVKERADQDGRTMLAEALMAHAETSVETLGHIDYKDYADRFSVQMAAQGDFREAARCQDVLLKTLATRKVHGRTILDEVLRSIETRRDRYRAGHAVALESLERPIGNLITTSEGKYSTRATEATVRTEIRRARLHGKHRRKVTAS
jgi:hypothetical protein